MAADERQNLTPDDEFEKEERDEKLEDLEASEDESAGVKGGGGTTQQDLGGSGPENLR